MDWYVYIVKCKDGSLYTGITTNIARRINEHNNDNVKGAKSLKGKRPVKLVYKEEFDSQTEARKREAVIKNWKRKYKLQLIGKKLTGLPCKSSKFISSNFYRACSSTGRASRS
ncbi:endonuclease [Candidatus Roizmanbacteria bacterium CG02_land_8_20_14_3_00_36_15]|uniref:Endonuclease n=2 Tax=Candidatus Roizmaniibacteriota TaxID=1752723 RepID=A0A2M8KKE8_9BACT|nr:MAG: endonuclease [Candidatus Roizmanbacteria bacterium CG03_land_8_20_14_0_80_36_21]PIV38044.1 MAG: endonuclease [Candidatus Roizmanbacteria bacterium CG02_land_8_20_14_3_00_36_15]PJA52718.1 MAG: endonuclease [Candidatus Roizmanbacteria bacterium CG_4_9_14_3_um_filter_36_11]PJC81394.1 MAG: endonuclease [Candidatus Roizmanbacteria bacterium CG_4_8_14_3_um_filter_36_10]PJE60388.1 MAG: endonuclease [Candidatus Roizmanbacteria bacterium CG10_big_fil_rev_8_21_14_0_10_36_26]